jgi:cytidine deaminase
VSIDFSVIFWYSFAMNILNSKFTNLVQQYKEKLKVAMQFSEPSAIEESLKLIEAAMSCVKRGEMKLNTGNKNTANSMGAALITPSKKIYTGTNSNLKCAQGWDAEESAIASMVKDYETLIQMIVAVSDDALVCPPCTKCRGVMDQIDDWNYDNTSVLIPAKKQTFRTYAPDLRVVKLSSLIPHNHRRFMTDYRAEVARRGLGSGRDNGQDN